MEQRIGWVLRRIVYCCDSAAVTYVKCVFSILFSLGERLCNRRAMTKSIVEFQGDWIYLNAVQESMNPVMHNIPKRQSHNEQAFTGLRA